MRSFWKHPKSPTIRGDPPQNFDLHQLPVESTNQNLTRIEGYKSTGLNRKCQCINRYITASFDRNCILPSSRLTGYAAPILSDKMETVPKVLWKIRFEFLKSESHRKPLASHDSNRISTAADPSRHQHHRHRHLIKDAKAATDGARHPRSLHRAPSSRLPSAAKHLRYFCSTPQ
jgi:hypothetical protein